MRDLIKEILKEEGYRFVSYSIVGILSEEEISNCVLLEDVSHLITPQLKKEIKTYLNSVTPFKGVYVLKDGKKITYTFIMFLTNHWYERLFRTKDPEYMDNPQIENPDYRETIDMLIKNKDRLAKLLYNGDIKDGQEINFFSVNGSKVSVGVVFEPTSLDGENYQIKLITQIKGPHIKPKQGRKKLPLY